MKLMHTGEQRKEFFTSRRAKKTGVLIAAALLYMGTAGLPAVSGYIPGR